MSDIAIEVSHLWKKFHRGKYHDSLRDLVPALFHRSGRRGSMKTDIGESDFWALKDVSFQVPRGGALGIIGPNGAGKSTILKLLTKILKPTRGYCTMRGRTGALIDVAAGFHPDLSGRENVYLQGAIMGMTRAEISRKLEEIIEFAGIYEFIDTPVKRYSWGMHARLGFSIAAHLDPDVLLIDEVLSVGDMAFQQRCVERMKSFKQQGVAIVFVSHNLQAVANLCPSALYLDKEIHSHGPSQDVIEAYVQRDNHNRVDAMGAPIQIVTAQLVDEENLPVKVTRPGVMLTLRVSYIIRETIADVTLGFFLHRSTDALLVYDRKVEARELGLDKFAAGERLTVDFAFRVHLARGQYHLGCDVLHNPTQEFLSRLSPAAILTVEENRTHSGVVDLEVECTVVERVACDPDVRGSQSSAGSTKDPCDGYPPPS